MIANIGSSSGSSTALSTATTSAANNNRKAQLEKQLATYTKELVEAQKNAASKAGALSVQLIQQRILAIQQQLQLLSQQQQSQSSQPQAVARDTRATTGNNIDISV